MNIVKVFEGLDDEVIYVDNLREEKNLAAMRASYNSIVQCTGGRILVEVGGQQQVKVMPGELLLIPVGKLVQPMLISTDIEASALLISDRLLKSLLASQVNIWNKAMYMKEIYVIKSRAWIEGVRSFAGTVFNSDTRKPVLTKDLTLAFLRSVLLLICDDLAQHENMTTTDDDTSDRDKVIFSQFLDLLSNEPQKRQHVSFYAEKLFITPKYLSTVCRKVSGKSPIRWITENVMEDCYAMLRNTNLSVKEISNQLGFPNSSFFSQYFREQAGVTPVEYRTKYKNIG